MINILKKFLVLSVFLSMMSVPSYADFIFGGLPLSPDDVCAYDKDLTCTWFTVVLDPVGDPAGFSFCKSNTAETVYCGHALPCGQPHQSKVCNPEATSQANCNPVDGNVICWRVPKPAPKTRECFCTCRNATGEDIDDGDIAHTFIQTEPFTLSCQEQHDAALPPIIFPEGTPRTFPEPCEGYPPSVWEDLEEYMEEHGTNVGFPFPPKDSGTIQCGVIEAELEEVAPPETP